MKKFLALILSGLMLVGVLACCGSSKTNTTTSSGSSDKVSLTWWAFPTFGTDGAYEKKRSDRRFQCRASRNYH